MRYTGVSNWDQTVDMTKRQEAKLDLSIYTCCLAAFVILDCHLHNICDDVAMADLNGFLQTVSRYSIPGHFRSDLQVGQRYH